MYAARLNILYHCMMFAACLNILYKASLYVLSVTYYVRWCAIGTDCDYLVSYWHCVDFVTCACYGEAALYFSVTVWPYRNAHVVSLWLEWGYCVGWSGVWPLSGLEWLGGFFLWMVFQKNVKDLIREYSLVVIYVVVGDVFSAYVEFFKCVKVWSYKFENLVPFKVFPLWPDATITALLPLLETLKSLEEMLLMAASDCLLAKDKMLVVFHAPSLFNRPTLLLFNWFLYARMNQDLKARRFADVAEVQPELLVAINSISSRQCLQ